MTDLNSIAKRIHNIQPRPVRLELDDGEVGVFEFTSTEFFQREFRGEGTRTDEDGAADVRLISSDDYDRILLGRSGPDDDNWTMVGEVVAAERAEE